VARSGRPARGLEYVVRLAVIDVGGRTLLARVRVDRATSDDKAFFAAFGTMLASVRFR
jgi:hypothetical protein